MFIQGNLCFNSKYKTINYRKEYCGWCLGCDFYQLWKKEERLTYLDFNKHVYKPISFSLRNNSYLNKTISVDLHKFGREFDKLISNRNL